MPLNRQRRWARWTVAAAGVGAVVVLVAPGSWAWAAKGDPPVEIVVLSSRADLVSGGDALVEIRVTGGEQPSELRVELNGADVTRHFQPRPDGSHRGLLTGLRDGANRLQAWPSPSSGGAQLVLTNHSRHGPIISGPRTEPWICETERFELGPAQGDECEAATRHDYFYRSSLTGQFHSYDPESPPISALVASTSTDHGMTVPYVVRRERGVINRGIYEIVVLHDPATEWDASDPPPAWNRKLHWYFEGGIGPWHLQGRERGPASVLTVDNPLTSPDPVVEHGALKVAEIALSRGFAVATTPLTRVNSFLGAETVAMVKEHLIETYGPVRHTTSSGCSGGSAAQHMIADHYPGLLDGIMPMCSIPDPWTILPATVDCELLERYYQEESPVLWANHLERAAVNGTNMGVSCVVLAASNLGPMVFDPEVGCTAYEPEDEADWVYNADTNPGGVRCTLQDWMAAAVGTRSADGFAHKAWDNVGVQYGLGALHSGAISAEQFVDLNANIGGVDIDHGWIPERAEADLRGLQNLYASGMLTRGHGLARVPILDVRGGLNEEIHESIYTQMTRARLGAANGHADNHVAWTSVNSVGLRGDEAMLTRALALLDTWVEGIKADTSNDPDEVKVLRHKPETARDTCWVAGVPDICDVPDYANTRMVAGAPMTNDIFKCQLKELDWSEYPVEFTDSQKDRLRDVFRTGVCDWTSPGIGQQGTRGRWLSLDVEAGRPLGPAPRSTLLPARSSDEGTQGGHGPEAVPPPSSGPTREPLPATGGGSALLALLALLAAVTLRKP